MLNRIIDEYGIVCKLNVANLDVSIKWYSETLGLTNDEKFFEPGIWAQLNCPGIKNFALGLSNHDKPIGSHGQSVTFMVSNLKSSKKILEEKGVATGVIEDAGKGVLLMKFHDPDGNDR